MKIPLLRLDPALPLPRQTHPGDAGVDLHARQSATLAPGERTLIPTGIAVAIPEGHVGLVCPRSGLAMRHGISVVNAPGVVDSGYRGELQVIAVNLGDEAVTLQRGDRIAQLVVVPLANPSFDEVTELPASSRGEDGFGSSGR
ncbi:MAG: dUTP diphosphatase [Actinomycetota bacterium]|nr:dUTP diphosphatase [Actinomycetota bacterium]